jgi:hypothetical protein
VDNFLKSFVNRILQAAENGRISVFADTNLWLKFAHPDCNFPGEALYSPPSFPTCSSEVM